jgi:hypothetical protein
MRCRFHSPAQAVAVRSGRKADHPGAPRKANPGRGDAGPSVSLRSGAERAERRRAHPERFGKGRAVRRTEPVCAQQAVATTW